MARPVLATPVTRAAPEQVYACQLSEAIPLIALHPCLAPFINCCQFTTTMSFVGAARQSFEEDKLLGAGKDVPASPFAFLGVFVGEQRVVLHHIQWSLQRQSRRHDTRGRAIVEGVTIGGPARGDAASN